MTSIKERKGKRKKRDRWKNVSEKKKTCGEQGSF
jgi:hypothetical protein